MVIDNTLGKTCGNKPMGAQWGHDIEITGKVLTGIVLQMKIGMPFKHLPSCCCYP